ncbi:unnamed protein product [Leptidea sinapis]|uniref:Conserved oligomeric Golgi complex subunit 3 N-terminal domain-containing protein n=1 Tax=Leptidea sinapis TaxID=189913 RepID=A0A5E4PYU1_9NEOP|nr:unnamed protein product [Leptidea sinapis]
MENMTIKEIQNKLLLWEAAENPLAPLTATQREAILDLEASLQSSDDDIEEEPQKHDTITDIPHVNTTYDFLDWYETLSEQNMKTNDIPYEEYYKQLADRRDECNSLTDQIAATLSDLNTLSDQYNLVSNKTTALHTMSEQLLADQNKLSNIVDHLSQRLNSHTISVNSDTFFNVISKIDECLEYMRAHSRGMALIRSYVNHILNIATEQVLTPDDPSDTDSMDTAYAVYFGKFQAAAPKLKMVISEIEKRAEPWATPSQIAIAVHEAQRRIKLHLATLQRSMQLYLANKETEFILFRPIRNNVVGLFMQLEQYLTNNGYTHDDILIVACPTPEQISVFISSASLISHSETVLPYGKKRPISAIRKPSVTSIPEKKGETTVETIQSQAT